MASTRVAIAGLGAIGRKLARSLADGIEGLELGAVAVGNREKAQAWLAEEGISCPVVALDALPDHCDIAVECAPASVLEQICRPMLEAGKKVMVLSAGALLPRPELVELARARGGQIIVPTGALLGLDAVSAASEGVIHSVRMITRKPPGGLKGAPHLEKNGISVDGLSKAKLVFSGSAREAAAGFPANVNVAAALSLAGIGPDATDDRDLGGPRRHPQLPHHHGRCGFGVLHPLYREHPLRKPEDRAHHRALGARRPAQAECAAAGGNLKDQRQPIPFRNSATMALKRSARSK